MQLHSTRQRVQKAQITVEYGLIVATIAILVLTGGMTFGATLMEWFITLAQKVVQTGT